ncbi:hypothetical protein EUGRSUZ_K00612 [Eucalyptus grandis]|uniref:Uncharacterized protein n=2 Tax=Eucalyptus grandis TaxID=71139 RepID=A0ACC3IQU9_EUCGR|nr:hypothetical protein EUGRSUZ_K00612 [Eucalyptus grandis]
MPKIEERIRNFSKSQDYDLLSTELRDVVPAHFVLKIKSFSLFAKKNMEKYESGEFEAGRYKWKLILYPNGDKSRNGEDHVSVYLAVSGMSPFQLGSEIRPFQLGWEIHAVVRLSVYDQTCDRYFTVQGRVARFHALKTEWGVPRYMPLKTFTNPSNGYLWMTPSSGVGECLMLKESASYTHEWRISRLSSLGDESFSDVFTAGDHKWKVWLFPRGNLANRGQSLSMFLVLVDADNLASGQKVNVKFILRLKDQNNILRGQQVCTTVWLSSSATNWGWPTFMPLKTVGTCLMDDSCVIQAQVMVLGTVNKLP